MSAYIVEFQMMIAQNISGFQRAGPARRIYDGETGN
jgi:hypothetical protein